MRPFLNILVICLPLLTLSQPNFAPRVQISDHATSVFMADLDGDGDEDIACFEGGKHSGGAKVFSWFEAPNWTEHVFNPSKPGPFTGDSEPYDMDGDGDLDFVLTADFHGNGSVSFVYWYENPGGNAQGTWAQHIIKALPTSYNAYHMQGLDIVDMDQDGKMDIVVRNLGNQGTRIYYQNSLTDWTEHFIQNNWHPREGQYCADLTGDGFPELVLNGYYYLNNGTRAGTWNQIVIDAQYYNATVSGLNNSVKTLAEDIDGDGDLDVYFASAEGNASDLAWFENQNNGTTWIKHVIQANFDKNHQAILADVDNDGDLDVYGGKSFGETGVFVFTNDDGSGTAWTQHIIASGNGTGMYSGVAGDSDQDGDIDFVGPWKYTAQVYYYENQTVTLPSVNPVSISPAGGLFPAAPLITLTTSTIGADIRFTIDGSDPDQASLPYSTPFLLTNSGVVKARAYAPALQPSPIASENYLIGDDGLVHHWRFDETTGTTAFDAEGTADGTLTNGPNWDPLGQLNGCLSFDGVDDRVDVGNFSVGSSLGITIAFWMRLNDLNDPESRMVSKASGTSSSEHDWMVSMIDNDDLRFRLKTNGTSSTLASSGVNVSANTWYHVAASYDGSNMQLFLDGTLIASMGKTGIPAASAAAVAIGNQPAGAGDRPFDGKLDDVRVYDRGLTQAEVQAIMSPVDCPEDVTGDGVVKYTGADNDRDPILVKVGGAVPTATMPCNGCPEDVNGDGLVKYTGAENDRDLILQRIGGAVPTATFDCP